mmetsp:Transcript_2611/g.5648  ORF Transcript_2611/g.5648 Transcript_2611/m.5648 type:complete len:194 (-) Transcript_2611:87-668(-)
MIVPRGTRQQLRSLNPIWVDPLYLKNYVKDMEGYKGAADADLAAGLLNDEQQDVKKLVLKSFEQLVAFIYLDNTDKKKYGSLLHTLSQQQSLKHDQYPKTLADATQALANHKHDNFKEKEEESKKQPSPGDSNGNGNSHNHNQSPLELSFAQLIKGNCYCCGHKGHYASQCPKKDTLSKDKWAMLHSVRPDIK